MRQIKSSTVICTFIFSRPGLTEVYYPAFANTLAVSGKPINEHLIHIEKMGLDLFHVIPSRRTSETLNYFSLDEFDDNPNFIQTYTNLIEEIENEDYNFEIIIFPDIETKEKVLQNAEFYKNKPFLIGDINNLSTEINNIEIENSVSGKEPLILKSVDNLLSNMETGEVYYYIVSYPTNSRKMIVLFYTEKGYQRKGMDKSFYEVFENNKLYFNKEQVIKASKCLSPNYEQGKKDLLNNFKSNFIDNFIEGESIFLASW